MTSTAQMLANNPPHRDGAETLRELEGVVREYSQACVASAAGARPAARPAPAAVTRSTPSLPAWEVQLLQSVGREIGRALNEQERRLLGRIAQLEAELAALRPVTLPAAKAPVPASRFWLDDHEQGAMAAAPTRAH